MHSVTVAMTASPVTGSVPPTRSPMPSAGASSESTSTVTSVASPCMPRSLARPSVSSESLPEYSYTSARSSAPKMVWPVPQLPRASAYTSTRSLSCSSPLPRHTRWLVDGPRLDLTVARPTYAASSPDQSAATRTDSATRPSAHPASMAQPCSLSTCHTAERPDM